MFYLRVYVNITDLYCVTVADLDTALKHKKKSYSNTEPDIEMSRRTFLTPQDFFIVQGHSTSISVSHSSAVVLGLCSRDLYPSFSYMRSEPWTESKQLHVVGKQRGHHTPAGTSDPSISETKGMHSAEFVSFH